MFKAKLSTQRQFHPLPSVYQHRSVLSDRHVGYESFLLLLNPSHGSAALTELQSEGGCRIFKGNLSSGLLAVEGIIESLIII